MLSLRIQPISQAGGAARYYFSKDNYYFTGELSASWRGQSAERLALGERVSVEQLEMILSGVLPNGEIIGLKSASGEVKHRGGYDLTFSAPKSVSYLALVAGDKDFIDIHQRAVQKVLQIIEKEAAQARKMGLSGVEYEKTGNLAFATILHDTSREQDPLLHTHALMMNLTERLDGKWRALASDMRKNHGTMEWIMANQIYLGLVYRSEVAMGVKSKGLEIAPTGDPHGLFEIKHFNSDLLTTFSKRRTQIEGQVDTMHSSSLKAHDKATQDTRKYKKETNPEALRVKWTNESQALGVDPSTYLDVLKQKTAAAKQLGSNEVSREQGHAVLDAIAHLEERRLSFTYQDVLQASLYFSLGETGYDTLIQSIEHEIKAQRLISLDDKENLFTTSGLIAKEKQLIEQLSTFTPQKKGIQCKGHGADPLSVQNTVMRVLTNKQGVIRIQQQSIVSKDVLLALINTATDSKTIRVLSPTRMLAKSINEATSKKPETLWQWLTSIGKSELAQTIAGFNHEHKASHLLPFFKSRKEHELIIVDDVGRCAPDDLSQLLSIASRSYAKVILLEKSEGLTGFKSDIPCLLDKAQVLTYQVADKQKHAPEMQIHEARDKTARLILAASEYTQLSRSERQKTCVLTVSKAESWEVNQTIRRQLKETGALSAIEKELKTLLPVPLTAAEKKTAKSYQPGWVLLHKLQDKTQKLTIVSVDEKKQLLVVREKSGLQTELPMKSITQKTHIYEERSLPVSIGELLVSTGDMRFERVKAGTAYEVTAFTRHGLKLKSGTKTIHLLNTDHLPLTYSYAKNLHVHDYKTVDKTILTMPSYCLNKNIMALSAETSRQSLLVITDDVEKAKRHAEKLSVKKSAISITLEASSSIKVLDSPTTVDLLQHLDRAIAELTRTKPIITESEKALNFAISHLSEREAVFSKNELLTVALQKAIGVANVDELSLRLNSDIQDGQLLRAPNDMLMTIEAKEFEEQILSTVRAGKNTVTPRLDIKTAEEKLNAYPLTRGQKDACLLIATTSDRFIMIQGFAGTGKTTMTKSAIDVVQNAKTLTEMPLDIIAVAPTHQAVKEMRALGIQAQTLKSFLIEQEQHPTLTSQSLVLLDESSMVSNRDAARLVAYIHNAGSRCALLGDVSQHQGIESGKPSAILLQEGSIRVANMCDLVRQTVQNYKEAVETLIQGDTNKALNQLAGLPLQAVEREGSHPALERLTTSVVENEAPLSMAVMDYLSRTRDCRDNTIVVIHENRHREEANHLIREGLMEKSELGCENKSFGRLLSTNYTTAALYQIETFAEILKKPGTYLLKKNNQYYKVTGIDEASRVVELQQLQGEKSIFMPEKENQDWKIELFKAAEGKISVGEKIHFKKSDKAQARFANERLVVTEVSDDSFCVKDTSGQMQTLYKNELKDSHWDYSYTSTSYSIQGSSSPFVIGVADTQNKKTNHFRSFYIMVSRGSLHAMIYTDNYDKLKTQLRVTPNKTSALEALGLIHHAPKISENTASMVKSAPQKHHYDVQNVVRNLSLNTECVAQSLLGTPNTTLSSKKEMRYGSKGSLSICLIGDKRGTWFNFETGEKGNLLHLIQASLNLDFKSSLEYAAKMTGDDLKEMVQSTLQKISSPPEKTDDKPSKTQRYALQLSKESTPIAGTLAEIYLKETRGINNVSGQDIRFHAKVFTGKDEMIKYMPALLCIARNKEQQVQSVQAIYLDKNTSSKAELDVQKKTFGAIAGTGVMINKGMTQNAVTYITEGVETGLSVRDAVQNERVIAVLGKQNMVSIDINLLTNKVVLCLDNDGKPIHDDKLLHQTIERLKLHGKAVEIALPNKKGDFNDVSKSHGVSGVIDILNKAFKPETLQDKLHKISMTDTQIKESIERISRENKLDAPSMKSPIIEQTKILQRVEMEIG
jgi:conjugative transfer relaxase protein TraI